MVAKTKFDPLGILKSHGGYYKCPKNTDGSRAGPLVAYTARDVDDRQFVGETYIHFSALECHGASLAKISDVLFKEMLACGAPGSTNFCGTPEAGRALATALALQSSGRCIYPEKHVIKLATEKSREVTKLVWGRHKPLPGERWWIVDGVCHNFSTATEMVKLIDDCGAIAVGVLCYCNRSEQIDRFFRCHQRDLPVVCLLKMPIPEYRQCDPFVADDVEKGNVVWRPTDEMRRLVALMN